MDKRDELIAKLEELNRYILKYVGEWESSSIRVKQFRDQIAALKVEVESEKRIPSPFDKEDG